MDTRLLVRFAKVAELGSVTKAAEALGMTQPVLSRDLAILEHEIGAKLFARQARGVGLTEAGKIFHARAVSLVRSFDELKQDVISGSQIPCGELRLGFPMSMVETLTSPLIEKFYHEYPKVVLTVYDGASDHLESMFSGGELDLAIFMSARPPIRSMNIQPLLVENMYLIGPAGGDLDVRRPVGWSALNDKPMILYSAPNQTRLKVNHAAQQYNLQFRVVAEVSSFTLLMDLVERGIGYAIVPLGAVRNALNKKRVTAAPLRNAFFEWSLGITRERPYAMAIPAAERIIRDLVQRQSRKKPGWTVLKKV
jgi:LysR family nitrogen assimilation transcriptional regulator